LLLSQLSEYHFLFNMLLVFISILQIAVANETSGNGKSPSSSVSETQVSLRQSLHSILSSRKARKDFLKSVSQHPQSEESSTTTREEVNKEEEDSFVDRVTVCHSLYS
jgi:hypothetical protein